MGRYFRIAWRNVWRNGRRTVIAVAAMALALTLIIFFDGMMGGFTGVMYANQVRHSGGNVLVHAEGYKAKANQLPLYPIPDVHAEAAVAVRDDAAGSNSCREAHPDSGPAEQPQGIVPHGACRHRAVAGDGCDAGVGEGGRRDGS